MQLIKRKRPVVDMNTRPIAPGVGNVLTDKKTIPITVERHYTDVNGTVIAKADALVIATGLNVKFPFFMLGEFDRDGGFGVGQKISPPIAGFFLCSFINGNTFSPSNIVGYNALNTINQRIGKGDIVQVYTDSVTAPNVFVWIVLKSNYSPLGSIIVNTKTTQQDNRIGKIFIREMNYYYAADIQLEEALHFTHFDNLGTFRDDSLQPNIWKDPMIALPDFITMEALFDLNQFVEISSYIRYEIDSLSINFNVELYR